MSSFHCLDVSCHTLLRDPLSSFSQQDALESLWPGPRALYGKWSLSQSRQGEAACLPLRTEKRREA